ncbi:hypothetical protein [Deinococcus sedimenti]|uniref:Uncharacterized protein n=1 Tax=Deinococcus sedimenti TaxID=1867090 RepID=A0ABQ2SBP6_9DEIO|nr:hypothetical protein [Deinococcus sedimenti]GGS08916.1 hypothetical protein GCM10008960_39010 [Deinococcus sedimenti]
MIPTLPSTVLDTLAAAHFAGDLPALLHLLTTLDDATFAQARVERDALLHYPPQGLTADVLRTQAALDERTMRQLHDLKDAEFRNAPATAEDLKTSDQRIEAFDHLAQLLDGTRRARLSLALTLQEQAAVAGR